MTSVLADLARLVPGAEVQGDATVTVVDVTHDSRKVIPGTLFCCVRGGTTDGHQYAGTAVAAGAVALLVDHAVDDEDAARTPQLVAPDTRRAMALVAARVHGDPSSALTVVGVTGTNGKTTTTALLARAAAFLGVPSEALGTLSGARTTPEATDLQRWFAETRDSGVQLAAIEVSSHALDQHRVDATSFAVAVFTNLTVDHLDYHETMEAYFEAKALLFTSEFTDCAVVNVDDLWGRRLAERLGSLPAMTVRPVSLVDAVDLVLRPDGSEFLWRGERVGLSLAGEFNVANALAAAEVLDHLSHARAAIAEAVSQPVVVPGRYELVSTGLPFAVVVDFAHTPDGLEQVLRAASATVAPGGKVRVVFGCGGDRDTAKRPIMGAVAARLADHVVLTSDNSRGERTETILAAIELGYQAERDGRAVKLDIVPDRREAIGLAIAAARPGDVVMIAGKGHETTLTIGDVVQSFDDRDVARAALGEFRHAKGGGR